MMAPLTDDAGETFGNVPSKWSNAGNHEHCGGGYGTMYVLQGLPDSPTKLRKQCRTNSIMLNDTVTPSFFFMSIKYVLGFHHEVHQPHGVVKLEDSSNVWILKPSEASRGRGVLIFDSLTDLKFSGRCVVQRYITDPLLIGGYKFDLRIYALVLSYSAFTVYIHSEGLVRFATEKFDMARLDNVYSHLTNSSINATGPAYMTDKVFI
ncbi:unnamed protein product [Protopolystoma xenopodis]|uniref:Tubulin--tyrosine ligase-like protein 9 n=1 Tax=Protopolystoma xenopodis TaxID=117903 RepID=A0A3S5CU33_9PLAT|nr:unnamed protein product [Protopolystoma xenopodis]